MTPEEYVKNFYGKFKLDVEKGYQYWKSMRVDHELLIELIEKYDIKSFFEVGTFEGYTALLVNLHPNIKKQKALDIHKDMKVEYKNKRLFLREKEFYGSYVKDTNVELEFCDSMKYVPKDGEQYDMVYIDGNHDYEHVKNDTELAFKLNPKIIAWHDFKSGHKDVNRYISELIGKGKKIIVNYKAPGVGTIIAYLEVENDN